MGNKILILGSKGMLGQELVRVFSDSEVLAWDREQLDITNADDVAQRVVEVRPTLIINAAAYNAADKAEEEPDVANRVNGDAVGYLAKAAADVGATFVHYSSDYIFDGTKKEGYREDDTPNSISVYGKSKLLGEEQIKDYPLPPTPYYLIRTSRLFGKEGGGKRSFVDTVLMLSKERDRFEFVDEEISSPTYVVDLAQATRALIESKKPSGIYHITNSGVCSWYGFGKEVFEQAHAMGIVAKIPELVAIPSSRYPRPAKRPEYGILLNTKLSHLRPWQDALKDYLLGFARMPRPLGRG